MMKRLLMAALVLTTLAASGQQLKTVGTDIEHLKPEGWLHFADYADVTGDGVTDIVAVLQPCDSTKMRKCEDGFYHNYNKPVLAIYLGEPDGKMHLFRSYDSITVASDDEYVELTTFARVSERGNVVIDVDTHVTAGSWATTRTSYVFRYQDGDFYLIGKEKQHLNRRTLDRENISENYLTGKRCIVNTNDETGSRKEAWETIGKKTPLQRLGDFVLCDD
ncbi:MAG: hypothetical protein Q4B68_10755 [Bacteroidales bacterium]|nr:hypothetical protein [Bacteroidales bacterium]